jgi:hypothetical protein
MLNEFTENNLRDPEIRRWNCRKKAQESQNKKLSQWHAPVFFWQWKHDLNHDNHLIQSLCAFVHFGGH